MSEGRLHQPSKGVRLLKEFPEEKQVPFFSKAKGLHKHLFNEEKCAPEDLWYDLHWLSES